MIIFYGDDNNTEAIQTTSVHIEPNPTKLCQGKTL